MAYEYAEQRPYVFTDDGQRLLLKIRDKAFKLIDMAGAARVDKIMLCGMTGDTWQMLACVDRLAELGDLCEVQEIGHVRGQDRIFTRPDNG